MQHQGWNSEELKLGSTIPCMPGEVRNEDAKLDSVERYGSPNNISYFEFLALLSRSAKPNRAQTKTGLIGSLSLTNFRMRFSPFAFDTDVEHRSSTNRKNSLIGWFDVPLANVHSVYLDAKLKRNLRQVRINANNSKLDDTQFDSCDYLLIVTYDGRWHPFRIANAQRRARLIFLQALAEALSDDSSFERSYAFSLRRQLATENDQRDESSDSGCFDCDEATLQRLQFVDRLRVLNTLYGSADSSGKKRSSSLGTADDLKPNVASYSRDESVRANAETCNNSSNCPHRQCSSRTAVVVPPPVFNDEADWQRELNAVDRVWRVSLANSTYELCASLPRAIVVPTTLSDAEVAALAPAFKRNRLPVFSFAHRLANGNHAALVCMSEPAELIAPPVRRLARPRFRQAADSSSMQNAANSRNISNSCEREPNSPSSGNQKQISSRNLSTDRLGDAEESVDGICTRIERCAAFQKYVNALRSATQQTLNGAMKANGVAGSASQQYQLVQTHDLPTTDEIRDAFEQLMANCVAVSVNKQTKHDDEWFTTLCNAGWLELISAMLKRANECAAYLKRGTTVFLVEPVSTDRCLLISALVELLTEPQARTVRGFQSAVQRTFVALGHPFRSRSGRREAPQSLASYSSQSSVASLWSAGKRSARQHVQSLLFLASNKNKKGVLGFLSNSKPSPSASTSIDGSVELSFMDSSNRESASPVFLLYLDCVHQLVNQHSSAFEFSEEYLVALADAYRLGLFDEFVFDCMREAHDVSLFGADAFRRLRSASGRDSYCESVLNSYATPLNRSVSVWHWSVQYNIDDQLHFVNPAFLADRLREILLNQSKVDLSLSFCHHPAAVFFWCFYFERHCGPLCFKNAAIRHSQFLNVKQLLQIASEKQPRLLEQLMRNCESSFSKLTCCGLSVSLLRELLVATEIRSVWRDEALQSVEQHVIAQRNDKKVGEPTNLTNSSR